MLPNMRISRKPMIGFSVVTSASFIMVLVIGMTIMTLSGAVRNNSAATLVATSLNKATERMHRADRALLGFALSNDPRYEVATEDGLKQMGISLEDAERLTPRDKPDLMQQIDAAHNAMDRWLDEFGMPRFSDMRRPDGRARIDLSFVAGRLTTLLQRFQVGAAKATAARVAPGKPIKPWISAPVPGRGRGRQGMAANAPAAWQEFLIV